LDDASYKYCNDKSGVLYPDQAVFLGSTMPCYDGIMSEQGIAIYLEKNNSTSFIILKGKGVLISKDAKVDVDEMLRCHAEVLMRIDPNEKLHYLTEDEISRLLDWEPEKYRRTLSK
jgi:rhamnose utilization protein RhaD (predicted bifunctional aldolase and dehydrogenase)